MTERPIPLTREEQAKLEIGHTEMCPAVKWALFVVGLSTLFAVPFVQTYRDMQRYAEGRRDSPWPQCCDIVGALPGALEVYRESEGRWISKAFQANATLLQAIDTFEKDLKAESFLTQIVLPPTQELLLYAGCGNEKGYVGRERWLFYRPGIDYCSGPGFLNPHQLVLRTGSGMHEKSHVQPDPRAAILQFHRQLAARNIRLVLMPTPDKATIHPEKFSSRYQGRKWNVQNPSYEQLIDELEAEGVLICDVTDALAQYRDTSGKAVYLATDTHWRPEAMGVAALHLARFLEQEVLLSAGAAESEWLRASENVRNLGDIAMMLNLPRNQDFFAEEAVTIRPVTSATGQPWQADPHAEVLLLGDSFANIYSLEAMNWGSAAGLAEELSFVLNRPVDTILRNDDGAYATREILSRELAQGEDRLAGKKVVVWQFAARELAVGDWKLLDMTFKQSRELPNNPPTANREVIVSGTIVAKSAAPRAGQMPYAHHIFTLDLADLQVHSGTLNESKIAVYVFSMRNHQNTPAFTWPIGKQVKLKLQPWKPDFFRRYGRINRTETDNTELQRPWWGEVAE